MKSELHTKAEWETIQSEPYQSTNRLPVIGGWLVAVVEYGEDGGIAQSVVFVPDPKHEWTVQPVIFSRCADCSDMVPANHDCPKKPQPQAGQSAVDDGLPF